MLQKNDNSMPTIRPYRNEDYEAVKQNLEEGDLFDTVWDSRENLAQKNERDPGTILVAEVDGHAVGNVIIIADGWNAFIFRLAVRKEFRRQKIGRLLIDAAEEFLRKKKVPEVALFVNSADEELQAWYRRRGYTPTGLYRFLYKVL